MKHYILFTVLIFLSPVVNASEYTLPKVCVKDAKDRLAFVEKVRDKIIDKTKKLLPDTKAAKEFDGSEMQQWLKLTYPGFMPAYLYDAGDKECADMHLDYLEATDAAVAEKAQKDWQACLQAAYRKEQPAMVSRLFQCYAFEPTPSK